MVPLELLPRDLQRLARIKDYCEDIADTISRFGPSYDVFQTDADYQRSISFSIFQIGELANGLTEEFRQSTAGNVPWRSIKGMRNIVVHGYDKIRLDVVWGVATTDIPALKEFCEEELVKARNIE